jgi:tetratricopeptide (TPR) repeat protein
MLRKQKAISKRVIKEDRLVTTYFNAQKWIDQNRRLASYLVGIPLGLIIVGFLWTQRQKDAEAKTATQLAKVIPYYDAGKYDQAINGLAQEGAIGLAQIVDENTSTTSGKMAAFYLGNAYFALREYDKARAAYEDASFGDKYLMAATYAGIASCYEAKGENEKAAEYFEKAASKNMAPLQAPENLLRAAANYSAVGKRSKAGELLNVVKREFSNSPLARDIERYIAEYGS